ncbi:MAG TPA: tRNA preQ1(34) S-adenosylmethionine ribosyltransferase-isomerase QueA [bacterium]|nr:tRNA preQ1(34) S-adenosylmethionine ribosyltransferase-isomerase QueA [bacterium]
MNNKIFEYELPQDRIAQRPLEKREEAKFMIVNRQTGKIEHSIFKNIVNFFSNSDVLVLNNTRVIPARLYGKKETGGKIEILLLKKIQPSIWEVLIRGKIKEGMQILFDEISGTVLKKNDVGSWILQFDTDDDEKVFSIGRVPIPPYIKRDDDEKDITDYQTVYAEKYGSVAAPTAGLHFTKNILKELENKGVVITFITLHIGYASLRIYRGFDEKKLILPEFFEISEESASVLNDAIRTGKKICAVGTSTVRAIESVEKANNKICACKRYTDLFIEPGYEFRYINKMITNFHLPRSTHLSMVCAFGGTELIQKAYTIAVDTGYRFYSYGDAMLII